MPVHATEANSFSHESENEQTRKNKRNKQKYAKKKAKRQESAAISEAITNNDLKVSEEGSGRPVPSSDPSTYEIKASIVHGFGVFATRDIRRGERIMLEEPLIVDYSYTMYPSSVVSKQAEALDSANCEIWKNMDRNQVTHQHYLEVPHNIVEEETWANGESMIDMEVATDIALLIPGSRKKVLADALLNSQVDRLLGHVAAFQTNSILLTRRENGGKGVFPQASRINHSCRPNVIQNYIRKLGGITIFCLQDIKKGDELLMDYCPEARFDWEARRTWLKQFYCFDCTCVGCTGPQVELTKQRLERLVVLNDIVCNWYNPLGPKDRDPESYKRVGAAVREQMDIIAKEKIYTPDFSRTFILRAIFAANRRARRRSIELHLKAYTWLLLCLGHDEPQVGATVIEAQIIGGRSSFCHRGLEEFLWSCSYLGLPPGLRLPYKGVWGVVQNGVKEGSPEAKELKSMPCIAGFTHPYKVIKDPHAPRSHKQTSEPPIMLDMEKACYMSRISYASPSMPLDQVEALAELEVTRHSGRVTQMIEAIREQRKYIGATITSAERKLLKGEAALQDYAESHPERATLVLNMMMVCIINKTIFADCSKPESVTIIGGGDEAEFEPVEQPSLDDTRTSSGKIKDIPGNQPTQSTATTTSKGKGKEKATEEPIIRSLQKASVPSNQLPIRPPRPSSPEAKTSILQARSFLDKQDVKGKVAIFERMSGDSGLGRRRFFGPLPPPRFHVSDASSGSSIPERISSPAVSAATTTAVAAPAPSANTATAITAATPSSNLIISSAHDSSLLHAKSKEPSSSQSMHTSKSASVERKEEDKQKRTDSDDATKKNSNLPPWFLR